MYKFTENTIGLNYDIGVTSPVTLMWSALTRQAQGRKSLREAVFAKPNCTTVFYRDLPDYIFGYRWTRFDSISEHMADFPEDETFVAAEEEPCDVVKALKESGAEILINYLPVGSEKAARFYAQACLEANVGFINAMPVFIASDEFYAKRFRDNNIPIIGDDVKSQVGATIIHRTLTKLFENRGVILDRTYQLNFGGNTDFLNMLNHSRLASKKKSKTQSVQSS